MSGDDQTGDGEYSYLSRRKVLAMSSAAALGGFAGCGGDGGGDATATQTETETETMGEDATETPTQTEGSGSDSQGTPIESTIHGTQGRIPGEINWNPYGNKYPFTLSNMHFDEASKNHADGETRLYAIDSWDWDADSNTLTLSYRDDIVWQNGDQWTVDDRIEYQRVDRLLTQPDARDVEEFVKVDDTTMEIVYKEPRNPTLVEKQLPTYVGDDVARQDVWAEWREKLADASDQSARDEIFSNLQSMEITFQEMVDKGLATGPWKVSNFSDQKIEYEVYDEHRFADAIEIPGHERLVCKNEACDQLWTNNRIDYGTASPLPEKYKTPDTENLGTVVEYGAKWFWHMAVNQRNKESLRNHNVRRAMAAVLNTAQVVKFQEKGFPIQYHSGIDPGFSQKFIGEDRIDQYIDYKPQEIAFDLADQYLERAGYSREDGTIFKPDGEEIEEYVYVPNNIAGSYLPPAQSSKNMLEEYGFNIDFQPKDRDRAIEIYYNQMGDWDLTVESHYAGSTYHPISYFTPYSIFGYRLANPSGNPDAKIQQWIDEGKERSPYNGKLLTPEIPKNLGEDNLSGATETINPWKLYNEVQTTAGPDRTREILRKLSWMWNFYMPDIDLMQRTQGAHGDVGNWNFPNDISMKTYRGIYMNIKDGGVKPKYE